jgi:hypothetical protein
MKNLVIAFIFIFAAISFGFKTPTTPAEITICHTPPGNPGNCHEITVSINALEAHLNHGDNLICHKQDDLGAYTDILNAHLANNPMSRTELIKSF